jgi:hypothetical protein
LLSINHQIVLPSPFKTVNANAERIVKTKVSIPDCSIFVPKSLITELSGSSKSSYKVLARTIKCGSPSKGSSFRYQATPSLKLPSQPSFEFCSGCFEDKKPSHYIWEDAYRQNRMSIASVVKHLASLNIGVPVLGLIWDGQTVRAHVNWCTPEGKDPVSNSYICDLSIALLI